MPSLGKFFRLAAMSRFPIPSTPRWGRGKFCPWLESPWNGFDPCHELSSGLASAQFKVVCFCPKLFAPVTSIAWSFRKLTKSWSINYGPREGVILATLLIDPILEQIEVGGIEAYNPLIGDDRSKLVEAVAEASELCTALPSYELYDKGPLRSPPCSARA